ncbi:MAG: heat-inducible transcription repressor HrcA [Actinobacteria bacterium]|nr:heat-inducible transcription repressor HrcA [Actinomycetota bacterium]
MKLTQRKKEILQETIVEFIKRAEPVSSQSIARKLGSELSPATIRKEMAELEEMGYLTHPHTSAGRIPTDMGYRYYVDHIVYEKLNLASKNKKEVVSIDLMVDKDMGLEAILERYSQLLAKFTNYLSMIVAPNISQSKFRHIELIRFEGGSFLLVLITNTGRVYKRIFSLEGAYNDLDLQRVTNILNSQLKGKSIGEIGAENIRLSEGESYLILFIKKVIELVKDCEEESLLHDRVFVHGIGEFLRQLEFMNLAKLHDILAIVENEYLLAKLLLNLPGEEGFTVRIGSEIQERGTDDLSLIASKYRIAGIPGGVIGVLGPKRMDYYRVIGVLNTFRENLSYVLDFGG